VFLRLRKRQRRNPKYDALFCGNHSAYASQSEADLALCNRIAFFAGGDHGLCDQVFRRSGLYRAKWNEKRNNSTYGRDTIQKAISACRNFYDWTGNSPNNRSSASSDAGLKNQAPTAADQNFGSIIPLESPPPPALPNDIFTGWIGDQIDAVAAATETPRELAATFAIGSLAIATQGRFCVRPEPGYFEQLAFWTATALQPGTRKTAVMNLMANWAFKFQADKLRESEPIIRRVQADRDIEIARIKETRAAAAKSKDETDRALLKQQAQELEDKLPVVPVAPRLLVEDVTPEHLATLLLLHDERLGILADEGGFLDNFAGRYSGGVLNLDLLLKAHTGSPVFQDRGNRGPAHLHHPLLSFGLAPQPSTVIGLVSNKDFRRRGLPARFFFFVPSHQLGYRTLQTQPVPQKVSEEYGQHMIELAEMEAEPDGDGGHRPRVLSITGSAWRVWKDFALEVEQMMRADGDLENLTDWAGKLPGACARIAGLLHLADKGPDAIRQDQISDEVMSRAIAFCRFAIPHAKLVFEGADRGELATAKILVKRAGDAKRTSERTQRHGDAGIITSRELWTLIKGTHKAVTEIEPVLKMLVDHNYLREIPSSETAREGRPSRRFRFNPEVVSQW
jgi:hypothetical protein